MADEKPDKTADGQGPEDPRQEDMPIFVELPLATQPCLDGESVRQIHTHQNVETLEKVYAGDGQVHRPMGRGKMATMPTKFPIPVPVELQDDQAAALRWAFRNMEEAYERARPEAEAELAKQLQPGIIIPTGGGNGKGFDFRGGKGTPYNKDLLRRMRGQCAGTSWARRCS